MDAGLKTPLLDLFRRGEVPRDVRLLAARGAIAPRAYEQMALLVFLAGDADAEVAATARETLDALPPAAAAAFLGRPDAPSEVVDYFAARGTPHATAPVESAAAADDEPLLVVEDALPDAVVESEEAAHETFVDATRPVMVSSLPVLDRVKLAMRGTREQRLQLIRDPNRLVAAAVLSSPKLTETEVETVARMANVSDDVLRIIGGSRAWTKRYPVISALTRNPKTPLAISISLVSRLNDRDLRLLSTDRNVPEGLRLQARKMVVAGESRKK